MNKNLLVSLTSIICICALYPIYNDGNSGKIFVLYLVLFVTFLNLLFYAIDKKNYVKSGFIYFFKWLGLIYTENLTRSVIYCIQNLILCFFVYKAYQVGNKDLNVISVFALIHILLCGILWFYWASHHKYIDKEVKSNKEALKFLREGVVVKIKTSQDIWFWIIFCWTIQYYLLFYSECKELPFTTKGISDFLLEL